MLPVDKQEKCCLCGGTIRSAATFPGMPITDMYVYEPIFDDTLKHDQCLMVCEHCGHAQLKYFVDSSFLYDEKYSFVTTTSMSKKSNDWFVAHLKKLFYSRHFDTVIDIGCNDAYLLRKLKDVSYHQVGIDPIVDTTTKGTLSLIGRFVEDVPMYEHIARDTLIVSSHFMEHIGNPRALLEQLHDAATEDTEFVFYFPCFDILMRDRRFDQVYHHHYHYYSLHSLLALFNNIGFNMVGYAFNDRYWGSIAIHFRKGERNSNDTSRHERYKRENIRDAWKQYLQQLLLFSRTIKANTARNYYGYGAGLQLMSFFKQLGIAQPHRYFDCIFDDDKNKDGLYYPNSKLKIKKFDGRDLSDSIVVVTAPNFSREIVSRLLPYNPKRIIVPFNSI